MILLRFYLIGLLSVPYLHLLAQVDHEPLLPHVNETGYPFIQNYGPEVYGAFDQNWAVLQDSSGIMYFGNGDGVLIFDGVQWELITLPNQGSVMSLALDQNNHVYVGGIGEYGYLESDAYGRLSFVSLLPLLPEEAPGFLEVWKTFATPEGVYFYSYECLFRWNGKNLKFWKPGEEGFLQSFWVNNTLFLQIPNKGLMHLQDDRFQLIPGGEFFSEKSIVSILPLDGNHLMIGTRDYGFFTYDGKNSQPFVSECDAFLKENKLYRGILLNDSTFALSTLNGGIVVMDTQGRQRLLLNEKAGLPSPAVFALYQDKASILWAGLNYGIAKIEYPSPFSRFDEKFQLQGSVSKIVRYQNKIYAGTDRGLFYLERNNQTSEVAFHQVSGLKSKVWDVLLTRDVLLVALEQNIYQLRGDALSLVNTWSASKLNRSKLNPNRVFVGLGDGISSLYYQNGKWVEEGKIPGVSGDVYDVVETPDGDLWLETNVNSIWRISFQDKNKALHLEAPIVDVFGIAHGLPDDVGQIYSLEGVLFFKSYFGKQTFRFNEQTQSFHPDQSQPQMLGVSGKSVDVNWVDQNDNIWFDVINEGGDKTKMVVWKRKNGKPYTEDLHQARIADLSFRSIFYEKEDNVIWYGGKGGIIRHDRNLIGKNDSSFHALIRQMIYHGDSLIYGGNLPQEGRELVKVVLPFSDNNFRFSYASPTYANEKNNLFQYLLDGFDQNWSAWSAETQKDYTNLPEGKYTFKVRARNIYGQMSKEDQIAFAILPPWYRTWWGYLLYAIAFGGLIGWVVRWRSAQLRREKEALEETVKKRTEEIRQKNLQLAQQAEKLKEMDRMKSRLFANISHEFRTPLTLIKGPVDQALTQPEKTLSQDNAHMIGRNTDRLLRLVNQLLDLSKLDAGKMKVTPTHGDINAWLRTIGAAFTSHAEQREIVYHIQISLQVLSSSFDHDKLEQIVFNLLSNAFKFTPDAGEVSLRASYHEPQLTIEVSDSGKGIPPDLLPHIFDRFYQVDDSNTREQEGTGIGLALTKELVTLMEGKISVQSESGNGTTFTVTLPLPKAVITDDKVLVKEDLAVQPYAEEALTEVEAINPEYPKREEVSMVLVIEDNADMRNFIKAQLIHDYQVLEAIHGQEGLDIACEKIPDLVITDLMMPQIDGITLCHQLKTDERTSHIPVIMLTAKAGQEHKIEGLETGADDYLTKPFSVYELKVRVKNLIAQRQQLRNRYRREIVLQPGEIIITNKDEEFLQHAIGVVEEHMSNDQFTIEEFQRQMGMSRMQLHRKLKALTDQSASEFVRLIRMKRATQLFMQKEVTVSEVAYEVGFTDPSYFAKCFKEVHGITPKEFMQRTHI